MEVPEEHMGAVVELLGKRRGQMFDMQGVGSEGTTLLKYKIPTRGLLGLRNSILTASRGTAILNTIFDSYGPWAGDISTRDQGSLVALKMEQVLLMQSLVHRRGDRCLLVLVWKFIKVKLLASISDLVTCP